MESYNGVSFIPQEVWSQPDTVLSTDACLIACGGYCVTVKEYFHCVFPDFILSQNLDINSLELLAVLVALKLWGPFLESKQIQVLCDNQTSVHVINSGRTRNTFLGACLREICFLSAIHHTQVRAVHIEGASNRWSDHLSRCHYDRSLLQKFQDHFQGSLSKRFVEADRFRFSVRLFITIFSHGSQV